MNVICNNKKATRQLIKELKTIAEIPSIEKEQLVGLANDLMNEFENISEIESATRLFFSLDAHDLEYVLRVVRKNALNQGPQNSPEREIFAKLEPEIEKLVSSLNAYSLEQTGLPFHRAAISGKLDIDEKFTAEHIDLAHSLFGEQFSNANAKNAKFYCRSADFPRYVGFAWGWPWKLRFSWHISTRQRKEDVGCHFQHGPFNGAIRGYNTYHFRTWLMIGLQGWGWKLAANNNHLFYKWWFVAALGLLPWTLMWTLRIQKY